MDKTHNNVIHLILYANNNYENLQFFVLKDTEGKIYKISNYENIPNMKLEIKQKLNGIPVIVRNSNVQY